MRFFALQELANRKPVEVNLPSDKLNDYYGTHVFDQQKMQEFMPLVERLNIYAARNRGWLPPNYGKTTYSNMDTAERAVVDSFHGDGNRGAGEKEYKRIMDNANFYLAEPMRQLPALMAAAT